MTVQTSIITGSFVYPAAAGERPASTVDEMEAAVRVLQQHKAEWAGQPIAARLGYLETLIRDFAALSAE